MVEIIEPGNPDILSLKLSGRITRDDMDVMLPLFEQKINNRGVIDVYFEFSDIEITEPATIWKDLKFEVRNFDDFRKIAIVGDEKWLGTMAQFLKPFTAARIKFFKPDQKTEAKKWISNHFNS